MNAPIISLEGVTKRYGRETVIDNLNLSFARGEFVTLLGPSGCGKSTTLRMIGGFVEPSEGRVMLEGVDITPLPPNKRNVNMVFQDYALFPHLTVRRNVAFGLELLGWRREQIARRLAELFDLLQLDRLADRRPDELSGGQQQRVALARALARDPEVLLLDEPLGALDALLRSQLQIELKAIQERTGKTFIFVTHDQEEALTMSDRVIVMRAGRIEQAGSPRELYSRPQSQFVAEFIGEANMLDCTVRNKAGTDVELDWFGQSLRVPDKNTPSLVGDRVQLVVRCEDIQVGQGKSERDGLEVKVLRRIYKGNRVTLVAEVLENRQPITISVGSSRADELGETIWIDWEPNRATVLAA